MTHMDDAAQLTIEYPTIEYALTTRSQICPLSSIPEPSLSPRQRRNLLAVDNRKESLLNRPVATEWYIVDLELQQIGPTYTDPVSAIEANRKMRKAYRLVVDNLGRHIQSMVPAAAWDYTRLDRAAAAWLEKVRAA